MPIKLTKVDRLILPDHSYLQEENECYFLGEYTARAGFAFSSTNDLIQNLKKPMDRKGRPEWKYKEWAINRSGDLLREALPKDWLESATIVPVPPSKAKTDPRYDDRLIRVLRRLGAGINLDVRELVMQNTSTAAAHETEDRPRPGDLARIYEIDCSKTRPWPTRLVVFDDLLTTGSHFERGCQEKNFPLSPQRRRGCCDLHPAPSPS